MFWGCLELRFGGLGVPKDLILGVQGSILTPFWVPFGCPQAPGQAPRDSLCSKVPVFQGRPGSIFGKILGGKWEPKVSQNAYKIDLKIDEFWSGFLKRFWKANGSPRGAKMLPKSIQKSMNFGVRFLMKFGCENGAKMDSKSFPK